MVEAPADYVCILMKDSPELQRQKSLLPRLAAKCSLDLLQTLCIAEKAGMLRFRLVRPVFFFASTRRNL